MTDSFRRNVKKIKKIRRSKFISNNYNEYSVTLTIKRNLMTAQ